MPAEEWYLETVEGHWVLISQASTEQGDYREL